MDPESAVAVVASGFQHGNNANISDVWKYMATSFGSILLGLLLSVVAVQGPQKQIDALQSQVTAMQVQQAQSALEMVRLQTQLEQVSKDVGKIADKVGVVPSPVTDR